MTGSNNTSVLLIDAESGLALTVVRCLAEHNDVHIHALSSNPGSSVRHSRRLATFLPHSAHSDDSFESVIHATAQSTRADLLVACSTSGTEFLVRRAQAFPNLRRMHLPPLPSFRRAADKWSLHLAALACGVGSPRTWLADVANLPAHAPFPLLLKPRFGEGGIGIMRAGTAQDLSALLGSANVTPANYIIQQFIEGQDIGCNVFSQNGCVQAYTMHQPIHPNPAFAPPSALRFGFNPGVLAIARRLSQYLNWTGVANFDVRIRHSDGKIFVLDMNPRFWANIYGSVLAGTNFVRLNCSLDQLTTPPITATRPINFYRGSHAFTAWLRGRQSDLACRLLDPLPDLLLWASCFKHQLLVSLR